MCVCVCVCVCGDAPPPTSTVMAEMVRLTTESSHLKQENEQLQATNEKVTQKAANLVGMYNLIPSPLLDLESENIETAIPCMYICYNHMLSCMPVPGTHRDTWLISE